MQRKRKRQIAQMRAKASVRKTKSRAASTAKSAHTKSSREKVRAYRERMRAKGLRLVQMWLPDTRTPEFAAEAHRQSLLANTSPSAAEDQAWVDSISDGNSD
jgi:DNA-binding LacI/PurR family transcriptional regulator